MPDAAEAARSHYRGEAGRAYHEEKRALPRPNDTEGLLHQQQAFGYTQEDINFFLEPMAAQGDDPIPPFLPKAIVARMCEDNPLETFPRLELAA